MNTIEKDPERQEKPKVDRAPLKGSGKANAKACPACGGTGKVKGSRCAVCDGTGAEGSWA